MLVAIIDVSIPRLIDGFISGFAASGRPPTNWPSNRLVASILEQTILWKSRRAECLGKLSGELLSNADG
jgi:hypothetical protein